MTECLHGFDDGQCATCAGDGRRSGPSSASSTGRTFALVFAPSLRGDTFLHLNRQGDQWKFRWYPAPDAPPVELAQSAPSSGGDPALSSIPIQQEIAHPHSSAPEGVGVMDSRYWFDVIERTNREHAALVSRTA